MRRAGFGRAAVLALLAATAPAHALDGAPPQTVPERARASAPTIGFNAPTIGFNAPSIGFRAPRIGFVDHAMTAEERDFAPTPPPAPAPPPQAPAIAGVGVEEVEGGVRYTLSADILFDFDKASLRPRAAAALAALSQDVRQRFPAARFRVAGYTDAKGSDAYNRKLSTRRAAAVRDFLAGSQAFAPASIAIEGRGEADPVAPNETPDGLDDPDGRQKNRRVEILVTPVS